MAKLLVVAETDGSRILAGTLPVLTFAQMVSRETGGAFDLLLTGGVGIGQHADEWKYFGAENIWILGIPALQHPTADRIASVSIAVAERAGAGSFAAAASSLGRDFLPRVAGGLDLPMVTDVLAIVAGTNGRIFRRPMFAGNIVATVKIESDRGVFSIRTTAFEKPARSEQESRIEPFTLESADLPQGLDWISLEAAERIRPELTTARVVVSGGRPLRDAETFERVLGGLADRLGGAIGATRAAVDSGIASNELQIGQTGKVVAPELYIAAGVSGSVQHLAGMKDSKVIVGINTDPNAPIFAIADYGLVADLHTAVPELTEKLK